MSAKRREVDKLVRTARHQGFTAAFDGGGHWVLTSRSGDTVRLPYSPRTDRSITRAMVKLRRLGFVGGRAA